LGVNYRLYAAFYPLKRFTPGIIAPFDVWTSWEEAFVNYSKKHLLFKKIFNNFV